ncbi:MAG TPA: hypothetical protein VF151_10790 [Gemmatimonadales bacterium]
MRLFGTQHPQDAGPVAPDTVDTIILAAGVAQAADWPTGTHIARLTAVTTGAGGPMRSYFNAYSTKAAIPASGSSASTTGAGGTGVNMPVLNERTIQIPGNSTGYSVVSPTSGYFHIECWRR